MSEYNECLNCPVCRDIYVTPKLYECGHTICEECMHNIDKQNENSMTSNFDAPIYKCPICRKESIIPYQDRPINHTLISLLDKTKDYKKLCESKKQNFVKKCRISLYDDVNFSHLALKSKFIKCEKYYKKILPLLYEAANSGKSKLTILTDTKELQTIQSLLSKKLFTHGIYKVQATPREFNIYILPEKKNNYRNESVNPQFNTTNETQINYPAFNLEAEYNNIMNSPF